MIAYWVSLFFLRLGILMLLALGLLFLVLGVLFERRKGEELMLGWVPALESRPQTHQQTRLFGVALGENHFLKVRVEKRRRGIIVAVAVFFVGGIAALLTDPVPILERADRISEETWMFLLCIFVLCLFLLRLAGQWMAECWNVRFAVVTVGFVTSRKRTFLHNEIGYEFRDEEGGFFGGTDSEDQPIGLDNAVLVFAFDFHRDLNRPSCSFRFHRFSLVERGVILGSQ